MTDSSHHCDAIRFDLDLVRVYRRNGPEYHTKPRARSSQGHEIVGWEAIVSQMAARMRADNPAFNGLLEVYRGDTLAFIPRPLKAAFLPDPSRQPLRQQLLKSLKRNL
ncbi:hypothetical protein SAMN05443999_1219 [Roseovarius azorensis]|uniref:Uncharacterized protein n=1 Tax=Roseovarius azorensis TaxID=1287727 RepID=A0A1H7XKK8_9RHOB|nr:hypothetical protein [Roseovarius azorensis]SEM33697.1 hypothetical protein SAMN05443999_1219 [Roseovarius azorensis]